MTDKNQPPNLPPGLPRGIHVYHVTQPYFFAHHHLHRRKIEVLRDAGLNATCLAFVPESLYQENESRYRDAIESGWTKIIRVPSEKDTNRVAFRFFTKEAFLKRRVLIHSLRFDPTPIIKARSIPFLGKKIKHLLEYEGHQPAELIYQAAFSENPRPPEAPPPNIKESYQQMLAEQISHVNHADALVLMSKEHEALWRRLTPKCPAVIHLPTLPAPKRVRFCQQSRDQIREELGISDRNVFVYAGNIICKWQRFERMCQFMQTLHSSDRRAWFLVLSRFDDIKLAQELLTIYGLEKLSCVLTVPESQMGKYLSAADIALFLRHNHTMNQVVTSGKLGEYLAAGLPVVTTGANTDMLNNFIRLRKAGTFIPDNLQLTDEIKQEISTLLQLSKSIHWRTELSEHSDKYFNLELNFFRGYVESVLALLAK